MRLVFLSLALIMCVSLAGESQAQTPPAALVAQGKQLFQYWCATCHGPGIGNNGVPQLPGVGALKAKYPGTTGLLEDRNDLSPAYVKLFVRNGVSIMPFFRKTEISDEELDAISAYLAPKTDGK